MCNIPPLPTKKKSQRVNSKKNSSSETDKQPGTPDFIGSVADVAVKTNKERKKQKKQNRYKMKRIEIVIPHINPS